MKNYWVAGLWITNAPLVNQMENRATESEALDLLVQLAKEQGATDTEQEIRDEARRDGFYRPEKHSQWSICWGEVDIIV